MTIQGTMADILHRFEVYARNENALDTDVLTLYLHVDPGYLDNQASQPAWGYVWVRNTMKVVEVGHEPRTRSR